MLVHHPELCPDNPKLMAFVSWWQQSGPFAVKLTGGNRTDAQQMKLYGQGRWMGGKVVTHAKRARDSAHGHSGAIDAHPVRALYSSGGVRLVYMGDEEEKLVRAEALARFNEMADVAERQFGLESGRAFPGLHDLPHIQDPDWKLRPLNEGVAP